MSSLCAQCSLHSGSAGLHGGRAPALHYIPTARQGDITCRQADITRATRGYNPPQADITARLSGRFPLHYRLLPQLVISAPLQERVILRLRRSDIRAAHGLYRPHTAVGGISAPCTGGDGRQQPKYNAPPKQALKRSRCPMIRATASFFVRRQGRRRGGDIARLGGR